MSVKDIKVQDSIKRLNQLEAILQLSYLKTASPRENQEEIDSLLLAAKDTLYSDRQGTQALNVSDQIQDIKKRLEKTQNTEGVSKFKFDIKTSLESVLEDLNKFNYKIGDYIESFGTSTLIYISKAWMVPNLYWSSDAIPAIEIMPFYAFFCKIENYAVLFHF